MIFLPSFTHFKIRDCQVNHPYVIPACPYEGWYERQFQTCPSHVPFLNQMGMRIFYLDSAQDKKKRYIN